MGEGAGVLVLEEMESAERRGAEILAEVVGYSATSDAYHFTSPPSNGEGALRAMRAALKDANICACDIEYLNAHASSSSIGDRSESQAIEALFGDRASQVAVSSTKSTTGHLLGAAGAFEAGITVLAVHNQVAPPTANLATAGEGCNLDYVSGGARSIPIEYALSNSFGFGGTNASLIFHHYGNGAH
jgi:3-oxoacyl-[acyl-carrier-protein] synthase II